MSTTATDKALSAYRSVGVESIASSASPHQLVLMLFQGARAAVAAAGGHMQRQEIAAKGQAISSAISIIDSGLRASLDLKVGGDLAQNLSDLYIYMSQRLIHANIKNDRSALDEVAVLLEQLGGAWESIGTSPQPLGVGGAVGSASALRTMPSQRVAASYGVR